MTHTIVVTGGSKGLGFGIASKLASAGYRVVAIARNTSAQLAGPQGEMIKFRPFDLADTDNIPLLIKELRQEFGPIYGLVNNAGLGTSGVLATMPDGQIERLVRLNTVSPIILSKYVVRSMMIDGAGRIVNIASVISFTGYNGLSVYGATKASLVGFTRSLAREVGPLGINVNAVAPGFVDTDMTHSLKGKALEQLVRRSALRRLATIDDVADAVEFLVGDKSRTITGTVLTVDAGNTA
jgi:3-oxoacyl-[acyl-carrier protein] reductase